METKEVLDFPAEIDRSEQIFADATKGKRFANYLIDRVVFYGLAFLFGGVLGAVLIGTGNESYLDVDLETPLARILDIVISQLFYALIYFGQEVLFKGKTLGKFITKTRAVNLDNSAMNTSTVLKRSFSRIVPFEAFSFLGSSDRGWHDRWTDTKVIEDKDWKN